VPSDQTITYAPGVPPETELRLCGDLAGKRVVELGSGANAVALAKAGARVMVVDPSADEVAEGRLAADAAEVRIEFHQSDLADLGFATSASVDLVLSTGALGQVDDISRVFRQVHRVLRPGQPFVLSVPHPLTAALEGGEVVLRRPYGSPPARTVSAYFTSLQRANFDVDVLLEPVPAGALVPAALLLRARKLGV
jgi:ubiquinone/menaquinone biosynthesis C-methylase UbiE